MSPDGSLLDEATPSSQIRLTSEEINTLVYLYLQESNFPHAAFALLTEAALPSTSVFQKFHPSYPSHYPPSIRSLSASGRLNGAARTPAAPDELAFENAKVPRGELVRKLWKALRWEEIEEHAALGSKAASCLSPFHLLVPHTCEIQNDVPDADRVTLAKDDYTPTLPTNTVLNTSPTKIEPIHVAPPQEPPTSPERMKRKSSGDSPPETTTRMVRHPADMDINNGQQAPIAEPEHNPQPTRSSSQRSTDRSRPPGKRARVDETAVAENLQDPSAVSESESTKLSLPPAVGGTWFEHRDSVTCLSWNPKDKEVLASSSNDGTAKLWHFLEPVDSNSSALRLAKKPSSISHKSIDSGKKAVTALVWHPDGTVFATASDGVGRLFTPSGQLQGILTYGRGAINSLKFNPSGTSLLAAKDDFTICLFVLDFDLKSPKQLSFEAHSKEVNDVDWLDDDIFASGGNDHTIFIYRANDRRPRFTLKGHSDDVTRVKWSPRQTGVPDHHRLLASVADDGTIMIWKLPHYPTDRGTASRSLSPSKLSREKEPSADDFLQVTVAPGSEYCRNRLQVVNSEMENKRMNTLEWSPNCREGHMIVAAGGQDSTVKLFNAETGECLHSLAGLEAGTGSIAFSPIVSSTRPFGIVAGGGWNGKVCFWDVQTGDLLQEYEVEEEPERQSARDRPMLLAMSWRHDGQHLAAGLHNKSLMTFATSQLL